MGSLGPSDNVLLTWPGPDADPLLSRASLRWPMTPEPPTGTRWVMCGRGSSVAELLDASGEGSTNPAERKMKTDLLLAGLPLSKRDHDRIITAVQWARAAANPPAWPVRGGER